MEVVPVNSARLLNQAAVKKFLLEYARQTRAHKFSRVSQQTLIKLNEIVRASAIGHVKSLPSKGKTI